MAGSGMKIMEIPKFLIILYPAFIVCFLLIASIFNMEFIKGILYLVGVLLTTAICGGVSYLMEKTCDHAYFQTIFFQNYSNPSGVAISWFTFIYLLFPMIPPFQANTGVFNPTVIVFLSIFALCNTILYGWECSHATLTLLGAFIGVCCGIGWFFLFYFTDKNYLFYNELISNTAICSRPSKQTFKCTVYKGGEIISSSIV
jgi:hypothetical protein